MDQNRQPVFLVEIKDDSHLASPSKRAAADQQMRSRYNDLLYDCPLPILYGLSAIGTKMRVYTGDTATMLLDPPKVATSPNPDRVLDRNYLADRWNVDILSAEGFAKMKEIVNFIKSQPLANACMYPRLNLFADSLICHKDNLRQNPPSNRSLMIGRNDLFFSSIRTSTASTAQSKTSAIGVCF
jgi:hypothetical protein